VPANAGEEEGTTTPISDAVEVGSSEKCIVRDLTTGNAFDMEELHSQYELFTLDAAPPGSSKHDSDNGKRMIPELECFTGIAERPETETSDVGWHSTGSGYCL
jgi:hypothetical protein